MKIFYISILLLCFILAFANNANAQDGGAKKLHRNGHGRGRAVPVHAEKKNFRHFKMMENGQN